MSFSDLSIKKLNQIIRAKATQLPSDKAKVLLQQRELQYEKVGLIALCSEYMDPSEIEQLLVVPAASSTASSNSPSSSSSSNSGSSGAPMALANMSPDQLRQQAQAMRHNPSAFRHMQTPPLTDAQILQAGTVCLLYIYMCVYVCVSESLSLSPSYSSLPPCICMSLLLSSVYT